MVQTLFTSKAKTAVDKGKDIIALELAEIKEISEIIFKKLEKKIQVIEALEASVDRKIASLERLVQQAESLNAPGGGTNRQQEIIALKHKGLGTNEIAEVLDIPRGEVDLVLNLHTHRA